MAVTPPPAELGISAPDFSLPGTDGKTYRLADIAGPKGTVVVFICNHCPYVKAVIDRIVLDTKELATLGIGSIAIMSNDPADYPEDSWDQMVAIARARQFPFPYVLDETQAVARRYGAVCTPDFFGFNARMELQYRGRLDASRKEAAPEDARRDLFEAMLQVARTGHGPADQIPSMGCSIKWKTM